MMMMMMIKLVKLPMSRKK